MLPRTFIVTGARKDASGNVVAIGGEGWLHSAAQAITQIRGRTHEYRVLHASGPHVRPYDTAFLRSDPDPTTGNNLHSLPTC